MVKLHVIPIVDEDWTVERIAKETVPLSWQSVFEYAMPELESISEIIERERETHTLCPQQRDLFRAFHLTPFNKIKVVILGQDPYPQILPNGVPRATGLSFSVRKDDSIPSSLNNIYGEVKDNYPAFEIPDHGCLEGWARQGILFLNVALTVREGKSASHINVWQGFTRKVIRRIVENHENVIFVLWGAFAQSMSGVIGGAVTSLTAAHPSGRSADRGFFDCGHFREINEKLVEKGYEPIDWNAL